MSAIDLEKVTIGVKDGHVHVQCGCGFTATWRGTTISVARLNIIINAHEAVHVVVKEST